MTSRPIVVVGCGTEVVVRGILPACRAAADRVGGWPETLFALMADGDRRSQHRWSEAGLPPDQAPFAPLSVEHVREGLAWRAEEFRDVWRPELQPLLDGAPDNGASMLPALGRLMVRAARSVLLHHLHAFRRRLEASGDPRPDIFIVFNPVAGTSRGSVAELPRYVRHVFPTARIHGLVVFPVEGAAPDPRTGRLAQAAFVEALQLLERDGALDSFEVYADPRSGWEEQQGGLLDNLFAFDARYGNLRLARLGEAEQRLPGGVEGLFAAVADLLAGVASGDPLHDWLLGRLSDVTVHRSRDTVAGHRTWWHAVHAGELTLDVGRFSEALLDRAVVRVLEAAGEGSGREQEADCEQTDPVAFPDRDAATAWIEEKVRTLERVVSGDTDHEHRIDALVRELTREIEADPAQASRRAPEQLRLALAEVLDDVLVTASRAGFRLDHLDRWSTEALAANLGTAAEAFDAVAVSLRERSQALAVDGDAANEEGTARFREALAELAAEVDGALRAAREEEAARRGWLARLLRRAPEHGPESDPAVQGTLTGLARSFTPQLEDAVVQAARGAADLAMARYLGSIVERFETFARAAKGWTVRAREVAAAVGRRLDVPASSWSERPGPAIDLLDLGLLDRVLERSGVCAASFLRASDLRLADLEELTGARLEFMVREYAADRLPNVDRPALASVLGRYAGDDVALRRELTRLLLRFQPLAYVDDEVQLHFEGGQPAQHHAMAELSDDTVVQPLAAACEQMGLPSVRFELIPGPPRLRLMTLLAGVPVFALAERLLEPLRAHREVMTEADAGDDVRLGALRDYAGTEPLPPLLPERVRDALERLRGGAGGGRNTRPEG